MPAISAAMATIQHSHANMRRRLAAPFWSWFAAQALVTSGLLSGMFLSPDSRFVQEVRRRLIRFRNALHHCFKFGTTSRVVNNQPHGNLRAKTVTV